MKIVVIGTPDMLPPELAENPDVLLLDPSQLDGDMLAALDAATGGMISAEGPLEDWARQEEREPEHQGMGDEDEDERSGEGDDEDEDETAGSGYGPEDEDEDKSGEGDDEEENENSPGPQGKGRPAAAAKGKGPKGKGKESFGVTISGRGKAIPALSRWAATMGRGGF